MDEFALIDIFFKALTHNRDDVLMGIGDDAACLRVPKGMDLVVSCDTLVSSVHFLPTWDAYDIARKAVLVNVSDMAAMGATPAWLTLALTLPESDNEWLTRFSNGLNNALQEFNLALVGGDTTRGPLSITLTIHGFVPHGKAIRRGGAKPNDIIFVSGELGAAAQAVALLTASDIPEDDRNALMHTLLNPTPRIDLTTVLQRYASSAIDISDGLSADLTHVCKASHVGACLMLNSIPVHKLVKKYQESNATYFAMSGGDDYELCFTVSPLEVDAFMADIKKANLMCYPIGVIEEECGLRIKDIQNEVSPLTVRGYKHF